MTENRDNAQDFESTMFHILDFAGTAGMTAKVVRCVTFKNRHKEKEMQETTSITITS